jgi:hypothetical protein
MCGSAVQMCVTAAGVLRDDCRAKAESEGKIVSFFYGLRTALKGATNGGSAASVGTSRQELVDAARMRTELGMSFGVTAVALSPSGSRSPRYSD